MASEGVVSPDDQMLQTTMAENGSGLPGLNDEHMTQLMGDYSDTPAINRPEFGGPSDVFQEGYGDFLKTERRAPFAGADPLRPGSGEISTAADLARWMYGLSISRVNLGRAPAVPPDRDIMGNIIPKLLPPDEALVFFERAGLKTVAGHIASNALSQAYAINEPGLSREIDAVPPSLKDVHTAVYRSMASALNIRDLTVPKDFGDALERAGFEDIGRILLNTLPLSTADDGTVSPLRDGLATKFPALAAKIAPIVNDALTFGVQGAQGPDQPGTQAFGAALTGVTLRALSPFGRAVMRLAAAGIGPCDTLFENREAEFQDYLRNVTLMTTFASLGGAYGLTTKEAAAGTLYDWATSKGFTPAEIARSLKLNGIGPIANRFALEMGPAIAIDPGYRAEQDNTHQVLQDLWNRYLAGSGTDSQPPATEEYIPLPGGSAANIYKQWLIGAIDSFAKYSYYAPPRPDLAPDVSFASMTGRPYKSPFPPPKDDAEATARFMGGLQVPALVGLGIEAPAAALSGAGEAVEIAGIPPGEWVTE